MTYTEFYCDPVNGSNLNAGSANAAPVYSGVGDSDGTSIFTPSDGSTPANTVSVGMFASIYVTAGATIAVFIGRVTAVAAGVNGAITVSTTAKSGTIPTASAGAHTITCKVGGYWKGPNAAVQFPFNFLAAATKDVAGDYPRVNLKNSATYSITAAITANQAGPIYYQGFTAAAGDGGTATIDGGTSGTSYILLTASQTLCWFRDFVFQNNGATGSAAGVTLSSNRVVMERCAFTAVRGAGLTTGNLTECIECEAYGCNQSNTSGLGGFVATGNVPIFRRCNAHHNTTGLSAGFSLNGGGGDFSDCVADTNAASGWSMPVAAANQSFFLDNCTAYANTGAGILMAATNGVVVAENCIFDSNTTFGVNNTATNALVRLVNCGYFNTVNTSGAVDESGAIGLTVSMTSPTAGNYIPAAGAGGARNAGRGNFTMNSGSWTAFVGTASSPDIGAAQSLVTGGGYIW